MPKEKEGWGGARPNAGRKAIMLNPVRITVDVPGEQIAKLDELAAQQGRSRSDLIREAITNILKR